jgi:hypothetical protein
VKLSTVVIPYKDAYHHAVATHVLQSPTPKVYQNGMYDASYFIRFDQPPRNYCMDTINMFHAWYSEMPKDLGFITAYLLRKTQYWKNEGGSGNLLQEYAYNAKDCYNTALCAIAWLLEAPEWAKRNYLMEFPLVFPNLMAGIRGLRRNNAVMESIRQEWLQKLDVQRKALVTMSGDPDYNPGSPQQNVRLIAALGSPDIKESNRIARDKVRARHPLNRRIMDAIDKYAEDKKLESAYIRDQKEKDGKPQVDSYGNPKLKTWHGRMLYNILPHGTDTGRQASQESPFWCGWQIQNIPREDEDVNIKDGIEAEPDFFFGEADKSQAEARYTAYASGDVALINAVEDETHDFHGFNASKFFGLEYTSIVNSFFDEEEQQWRHKTLNKPIRDLSKRTNHGANYNMAARVLLDTMGIDRVILAKSLLKLPRGWNLLQVCQYLLDNFDKTYPVVRGEYYDWIKKCIRTTHMLVGATGWTRYCFGKPWENKRDMNRYAAHVGQSLNAMVLNTGVMRVFYNIALRYTSQFKFCAQIHDSILFQYRKDQPWLAFAVAHEMHNPITITDAGGITRNMSVPVDVKGGSEKWGSLKELRVTMLDAEQKALLAKHIETSTYRPPSF